MAYERYPRGDDPQRGSYGRDDVSDDGQDYGSTNDRYGYSSARDYQAAGDLSRSYGGNRGGYGAGSQRDRQYGGSNGGDQQRWTSQDRAYAGGDRDEWRGQGFAGGGDYYRGDRDRDQGGLRFGQSGQYGRDDNQRFGQFGGQGGRDDQQRGYGRDTYRQQRGTYDRQPQGYDNDRGFIQRAGDEVRSWFGDEEAERRREQDARRDEQQQARDGGRDDHYRSWRNQQIAAFDRDYDEYRQENQSKFHNEFSSFRTERQGQRDLLGKVEEHAEVVGSDGEHVGTVDKVRGDRIILTKSDKDAGGHHHSIPSRWLQTADATKVTLRKTAAEAKQHWRDEERSGALFGQDDDQQRRTGQSGEGQATNLTGGQTNLNRSFSGTY